MISIQKSGIGFLFLLTQVIVSNAMSIGWTKAASDPSVVLLHDSFGHCTGTRVSRDGYILTARHCFNACLIRDEFVDKKLLFPADGWQSPVLYTFPNSKKAICKVEIDGIEQDVEVVAGSNGFMIPSEQATLYNLDKATYLQFLESKYLHNGDFAIIKQKKSAVAFACKKINSDEIAGPSLSQSVSYKGYPAASTGRPPGADSDGESLSLSVGVVVNTILVNSCLKPEQLNMSGLTIKYDRPELLLSTVDVLPGASGSALLNSDGEIIGLINSTFVNGVDIYKKYCSGSAVALKVSEIVSNLKKKNMDVKNIFSCQ